MSMLLDVETLSVFEAAFHEARQHRWIESQKARCDLGNEAFLEWYKLHWRDFLRHRHVEHLRGEIQWNEFQPMAFGVLLPLLEGDDWLPSEIIELYRNGGENLSIILHAFQNDWPMDSVLACLYLINMNDARLDPRFN